MQRPRQEVGTIVRFSPSNVFGLDGRPTNRDACAGEYCYCAEPALTCQACLGFPGEQQFIGMEAIISGWDTNYQEGNGTFTIPMLRDVNGWCEGEVCASPPPRVIDCTGFPNFGLPTTGDVQSLFRFQADYANGTGTAGDYRVQIQQALTWVDRDNIVCAPPQPVPCDMDSVRGRGDTGDVLLTDLQITALCNGDTITLPMSLAADDLCGGTSPGNPGGCPEFSNPAGSVDLRFLF